MKSFFEILTQYTKDHDIAYNDIGELKQVLRDTITYNFVLRYRLEISQQKIILNSVDDLIEERGMGTWIRCTNFYFSLYNDTTTDKTRGWIADFTLKPTVNSRQTRNSWFELVGQVADAIREYESGEGR